jgi:hypothetical protein
LQNDILNRIRILKMMKFKCCPHGTKNSNCPNCQVTFLLLVFKYADLPWVCKDVKKIIISLIYKQENDTIYCSNCLINNCKPSDWGYFYKSGEYNYPLDNMFRYGKSPYCSFNSIFGYGNSPDCKACRDGIGNDNVYLTGGYDSDFDNGCGHFVLKNKYMNFKMFKKRYFTRFHKITVETLNKLRICSHCVNLLLYNGEIDDHRHISKEERRDNLIKNFGYLKINFDKIDY